MEIDKFSHSNEDVFFVIVNSYSELLANLRRSSNLYVVELLDRVDQQKEVCMGLFGASSFLFLVVFLVTIPVVGSVNKQKDKVLSLFCEIDQRRIKLLAAKCENYV